MKLTVIIPVSGYTEDIGKNSESVMRKLLHPDTKLEFISLEKGFPAIESETHAIFNAPGVVMAAKDAWERGSDGVFVHCFDDPGVLACRELLPIPVLGGYQAAVNTARLIADRFAIITTDEAGILSEERKVHASGVHPAAIRAVNMDVLELRGDQEELLRRLEAECVDLWNTERTSAVVLGCTGMYGVVGDLQDRLRAADCPVTVVEPFATAMVQLEMLVKLGYSNHISGLHLAMDRLNWYEKDLKL